MSTEFKKIIKNNETYYVLEDASAGATSAGAVASVAMPLGPIRRRIKKLREKAEKVSVPKAKPRNPAGMGSNPGRGTKVHKNKKEDQKRGKEKHKKPFYENLLDELNNIADVDLLNELSTEKLAQYKKAAGKAASAADKAGDYKTGDKRFRGIVKATKKQFKNETEPKKQDVEEGLKDPKDNPCWKGYKPVGTKKKGGKTVPNCVPVKEDRYITSLKNKLNKITK